MNNPYLTEHSFKFWVDEGDGGPVINSYYLVINEAHPMFHSIMMRVCECEAKGEEYMVLPLSEFAHINYLGKMRGYVHLVHEMG